MFGRCTWDWKTDRPSRWELCHAELSPQAQARTTYLDPRPYSEFTEIIQKSAFCVFPSYAEALPLSWLEAMACGKPAVAYDFGWAPEIVTSGQDGLLVPLGYAEALARAMVRLLGAPDEALELDRRGRAKVEKRFSGDGVAEQSIQWYTEVVKSNGTRA